MTHRYTPPYSDLVSKERKNENGQINVQLQKEWRVRKITKRKMSRCEACKCINKYIQTLQVDGKAHYVCFGHCEDGWLKYNFPSLFFTKDNPWYVVRFRLTVKGFKFDSKVCIAKRYESRPFATNGMDLLADNKTQHIMSREAVANLESELAPIWAEDLKTEQPDKETVDVYAFHYDKAVIDSLTMHGMRAK